MSASPLSSAVAPSASKKVRCPDCVNGRAQVPGFFYRTMQCRRCKGTGWRPAKRSTQRQTVGIGGWTFIETLIVCVIIALVAAGYFYPKVVKSKQSADYTIIKELSKRLNDAVENYVSSGGTIDVADTAPSVLLKLQTPLTSATVKATGAFHTFFPPNYDLTAYSTDSATARLVWSGTRYDVTTSGAGYRPVMLSTPKSLTPVSRTSNGQTFATSSAWVWEYNDSNIPSAPATATLNLAGPTSITAPGSYTWTLTSTLSGTLGLTLRNGQSISGSGTTFAQSAAFNYGDVFSFSVVGVITNPDGSPGGTVTLPVTVNIPITSLSVSYAREDTSTSTSFTYAQVTTSSTTPSVRNGIVLSLPGNPTGVSIYYTYDGTEPTQTSILYTGPFHVPVASWSSSVSLKAVAVSTVGGYKAGPVTTVTLLPQQVQLPQPIFSPGASSTILETAPVTVAPPDATYSQTRTALGATPGMYSSSGSTFYFSGPN